MLEINREDEWKHLLYHIEQLLLHSFLQIFFQRSSQHYLIFVMCVPAIKETFLWNIKKRWDKRSPLFLLHFFGLFVFIYFLLQLFLLDSWRVYEHIMTRLFLSWLEDWTLGLYFVQTTKEYFTLCIYSAWVKTHWWPILELFIKTMRQFTSLGLINCAVCSYLMSYIIHIPCELWCAQWESCRVESCVKC